MSLAVFAQSLRASQDRLMEEWLEAVRRAAVPSAQELPEPQLRDHLPDLLDEILTALAGEPTPAVEAEGR
jgi:hypothetical protein